MASYEFNYGYGKPRKVENIISARLRVYMGKNQPYRTKTVKVPKGMTGKKAMKEFVSDKAKEFEAECKYPEQIKVITTFSDYARRLCNKKRARQDLKDSTFVRYISYLENRIDVDFGRKAIDEISKEDIEDFYDNMLIKDPNPDIEKTLSHLRNVHTGEPLSRKTIREHIQFTKTIFECAVVDKLIIENPAASIKCKSQAPIPKFLQVEEVVKLSEYIKEESLKWMTITYMLISTGCRRGEIVGLKEENIDWKNKTVYIGSTLLSDKGIGVHEEKPKTDSSKRNVFIPDKVISAMKEYSEEQEARKKAYGDQWIDSPYFFTQDNGDRMHPDSVTGFYRKFSKKHADLPHISPHMLRHSFASFLISENMDIAFISNAMGHYNSSVTLGTYTHMFNKNKASGEGKINDKMNSLIS